MHRAFECQISNYIFVTNFDSIIQQHNISITFDNRADTRAHDDAIDNSSSYLSVRINRRNFEILSISAIMLSSSSQSMFAIASTTTTIQSIFDQSANDEKNFLFDIENDSIFSSSISSLTFESTRKSEISKSNQFVQSSIETLDFRATRSSVFAWLIQRLIQRRQNEKNETRIARVRVIFVKFRESIVALRRQKKTFDRSMSRYRWIEN